MANPTDNKDNTQEKTPLHKQWWFWLIIVIILAVAGYFGRGMLMNKPQSQAFSYYF
jgi:hypothetical protein